MKIGIYAKRAAVSQPKFLKKSLTMIIATTMPEKPAKATYRALTWLEINFPKNANILLFFFNFFRIN